ncbi:methylmalonic aciduria and homocystinuria type D homolog, mitochondrial [Nephila pilipes]|uniref:Methylmalonic aciduria and homocystinuria type D homolog, mitochondrial n=1 Tax=Nephila pilipes TaxID=299642 RepID=A0A8X6TLA8_NEPPI|nr:methylmalonic aciduria and homocystinuria type D homolog, mitochondrial [Nephila pilipes]
MAVKLLKIKMLIISARSSYLLSRKYLLNGFKCIYSGRVPTLLSKVTIGSPTNNSPKKEGYGEKEICLLSPIDIRTPLPGNMGVLPLEMLYTTKIQKLPAPTGDQWRKSIPLPEEKYHCLLSQAAKNATEKALSLSSKLECSAFSCPELLKKDFEDLFPTRNLNNDDLTVITLCLKTENDMSSWSETGEIEREKHAQNFVTTAEAMCAHLKQSSYWADFIHPNSGKPHSSPLSNSTMFETDLRYRNFGFSIEDLGCCRIISHYLWGTNIFVGAIFTNASVETLEVENILAKDTEAILRSPKDLPF